MKYLAAIVLALAQLTPAAAQLRTIPKEAQLGVIRHLQGMTVEIDGQPRQLSAGAQIRSLQNRIIVPTALPAGVVVKYLYDGEGMVHRVWIVTEEEAVETPPQKPQPVPQTPAADADQEGLDDRIPK